MRDYRNAKAMAQTLREAFNEKSITLSQSESLELVARILGVRDWNVLSAKIAAEEAKAPVVTEAEGKSPSPSTCFCSFCGKSQHEVDKLIAGPDVFICDKCVGLCEDVLSGYAAYSNVEITQQSLEPKSTEELVQLKAKITRGLSIARQIQDVIKTLSTDLGSSARPDTKLRNPQVGFYLRKSPGERRAYATEVETRIQRLERAMAVTTEALLQRQ
jgi:hypothetical protein